MALKVSLQLEIMDLDNLGNIVLSKKKRFLLDFSAPKTFLFFLRKCIFPLSSDNKSSLPD